MYVSEYRRGGMGSKALSAGDLEMQMQKVDDVVQSFKRVVRLKERT